VVNAPPNQRPVSLDEAKCAGHGHLADEIPDEFDLLEDAVKEHGAVTSTNQQPLDFRPQDAAFDPQLGLALGHRHRDRDHPG
jgi:ferredoxin